jgi:hypothetical protein
MKKPLSDANYGWYQVRFIGLARAMYDEGGEAALKRLWAYGQAERQKHQNPAQYFAAHGTIAGWSEGVHARDLREPRKVRDTALAHASREQSEVNSPRTFGRCSRRNGPQTVPITKMQKTPPA